MADVQKPKKRERQSTVTDSAKKRRKKSYDVAFQRSRVHLGTEHQRWRQVKVDLGVKTDAKLAKLLLDRFDKDRIQPRAGPSSVTYSSTPIEIRKHGLLSLPVSEISSASEKEQPVMSGIETMDTSDGSNSEAKDKMTTVKVSKFGRVTGEKKLSSSFVDPFDVSIDVTLEESSYEDSDSDYEPSFVWSANLPESYDSFEEVVYEEIGFGLERDSNSINEEEEEEPKNVPGVKRITSDGDCDALASSTMCLTFLSQLKVLGEIKVQSCSQKDCPEPVELTENFVGSAVYLKWVCCMGHVSAEWCSQPVLNKRLHSGDFLVCGSILTSGNNFGKLCLWAKMLNLKFPSADQFHRIQSTYMIPTIDIFWQEHQRELFDAFQGKQVVVLGDGRNDSPGHSSQYCSYSLMENESKKILCLKTVDKRMTDRKSVNMEKLGFEMAMSEISNLNITEVVTDAHLGIGAIMKSKYPELKHSHDIWHVAKNLGKKLMKVAQKKGNERLVKWTKDIINHFWFCCKEATSCSQFVSLWRSVLNHITNQHEWLLPDTDGNTSCMHEPLSPDDIRDKPWLDARSDAMLLKDLAAVVLDKRLLNKISYYLNCRSTAELEGFHSHILMYCAKRFAYSPPVYRVRNILAALDNNMNVNRETLLNKDGTERLQRLFNKKSGRWTAHTVKVAKSYDHVIDILNRALKMRIHDKVGMRKTKDLELEDPRRLAANIAPFEPAPTRQIYAEKQSRF